MPPNPLTPRISLKYLILTITDVKRHLLSLFHLKNLRQAAIDKIQRYRNQLCQNIFNKLLNMSQTITPILC